MKKSRCWFIVLSALAASFALIIVFFVKIGFISGMFFLAASWTLLVSFLRFSSNASVPVSNRLSRPLRHQGEPAPVRQIKQVPEEAVLIPA